jgi:hypothetical protein
MKKPTFQTEAEYFRTLAETRRKQRNLAIIIGAVGWVFAITFYISICVSVGYLIGL